MFAGCTRQKRFEQSYWLSAVFWEGPGELTDFSHVGTSPKCPLSYLGTFGICEDLRKKCLTLLALKNGPPAIVLGNCFAFLTAVLVLVGLGGWVVKKTLFLQGHQTVKLKQGVESPDPRLQICVVAGAGCHLYCPGTDLLALEEADLPGSDLYQPEG